MTFHLTQEDRSFLRVQFGMLRRTIMDGHHHADPRSREGSQAPPQPPMGPEPIYAPVAASLDHPDGPLDQHTLGHVLTELAEWESDRIESEGPLTIDNIRQQLIDSGYGVNALDQVLRAWPDAHGAINKRAQPTVAEIEAMLLDLDIDDFRGVLATGVAFLAKQVGQPIGEVVFHLGKDAEIESEEMEAE